MDSPPADQDVQTVIDLERRLLMHEIRAEPGEIDRLLHPAVVRPGRCLAHVEIGPLAPAEASTLLGRTAAAPLTLAEVYAMRNGLAVDRPAESGTGQYL